MNRPPPSLQSVVRRGGQLARRWRDVDLAARTYKVTETLQRVPGTAGKTAPEVMPTKTEASRASGHLAAMAATALADHRDR